MANLKTKLSAAMLALIAAGASAPVLFDQFISEKEGNALVAVVDPGGVWSLCHGVSCCFAVFSHGAPAGALTLTISTLRQRRRKRKPRKPFSR